MRSSSSLLASLVSTRRRCWHVTQVADALQSGHDGVAQGEKHVRSSGMEGDDGARLISQQAIHAWTCRWGKHHFAVNDGKHRCSEVTNKQAAMREAAGCAQGSVQQGVSMQSSRTTVVGAAAATATSGGYKSTHIA